MTDDPSAGWDAVAADFEALRSSIGVDIVQRWARDLPRGTAVIDIGCGTGWPIATALAEHGFNVFGVDASPTLLAAFRRNLPGAHAACEAVQSSRFFDRRFDAAIAIGLIFLIEESEQIALIRRVRDALHPGARFLFTAPREACAWTDSLTGRTSRSLGEAAYRAALIDARFTPVEGMVDDGGNRYFASVAT
ncbi:class I SAM-dependent methyltransferase [Sphingomonas elodea]|uniref:class I SAM-dependent methyltransferase n=1 Tax=Sphingomonas elodea TaxID=179878 RepID=UPI0002632138|nr:class I SAM-dependent methyltransferase [Sphingomonas elodea]